MERIALVVLTMPGAQSEDAQWTRLILRVLSSYAEVLAVAPDDIDPETLLAEGAAETAQFSRLAVSLDLALPQLATGIAATAREFGAATIFLTDIADGRLAPALVAEGLNVQFLSLAEAGSDATCPPPFVDVAPIDRTQARHLVGLSPDQPILLAVDGHDALPGILRALDVLAHCTPLRPHLVIAGHAHSDQRARQRAELRNVSQYLTFCGPVPDHKRAALFSAATAFLELGRGDHGLGGHGSFAAAEAAAARLPRLRDAGEIPSAFAKDAASPASPPYIAGDHDAWRQWIETRRTAPPRSRPATTGAPSQVSVVVFMPTLRCRPWLEKAIDSVVGQTHPHWRLFVVDDAGNDVDTELLDKYPQVTFVKLRNGLGPYGIANLLLAGTESDLVAFHDADDWSAPSRLSEQIEFLRRNEYDAVGSWSRIVDLHGDVIGVEARPRNASLAIRRDMYDHLLHPTSVFQRRALRSLRGFDSSTNFGADTELHLRAALFLDIGNLPKMLYTRRSRPTSLTQTEATGFRSAARSSYIAPIYRAFEEQLQQPQISAVPTRTLGGKDISSPNYNAIDWVRPSSHASPLLNARLMVGAGVAGWSR